MTAADRINSNPRGAWRFVGLHLLLLAVLIGALAFHARDYALDDFFITYRYADNLAREDGFRFNPGETVFGTTAPGHGLLLAALAAVSGAPLPRVGSAVTALAVAWICALLIRASYPQRRYEGVLAAWLLAANTFFWLHIGGEVFTVTALLMTAGHLAARRPVAAGIVAGLAVWFRPDAALGVAALGTLLLVRGRRLPHRFGWPAAAVIASGLLAAWAWFGSVFPETLEAKRLQTQWRPDIWPSGVDFWPRFLQHVAENHFLGTLIPLVAFGLVGCALALRRADDAVRTLVLWAATTIVVYPLLGVAMYPWYGLPLLFALITGFAYAVGAAGRAVAAYFDPARPATPTGRPPRRALGAIAAIAAGLAVAALLSWPLADLTWRRTRDLLANDGGAPRLEIYREAGHWLAAHSPVDSRIAALEVGALAYYSQRHVHDILGLVSPASLPGVARGDLVAAFHAGRPDHFLYYSPLAGLLDPIIQSPGFAAGWEVAHRIRRGKDRELILYRRRGGGADPTMDVLR